MAARAENLISYQAAGQIDTLHAELTLIDASLAEARSAAQVSDLRTRRRTLQWQTIVREADEDYRRRRYEEALQGYRRASRLLLTLIDRNVDRYRIPLRWPSGARVTDALVQVSAGMLNHLAPQARATDLVLTSEPITFSEEDLGAVADSRVEAAHEGAESAIEFAERASGAAEQGRWEESSKLFSGALRRIRGQTPDNDQLRADVLLNLGAIEIQRGDTTTALRHLTRARQLFQQAEDQLGVAEVLHNTGLAHLRNGDGQKAIASLDEAEKVAKQSSFKGLLEEAGGSRPSDPPAPRRTSSSTRINREILTGPILASPIRSRIDTTTFGRNTGIIDTIDRAEQLGKRDLSVKFRAVNRGVGVTELQLATPTQKRHDEFLRRMTVRAGDESKELTWTRQGRLEEGALSEIFQARIDASRADGLGLAANTPEEIATNLPHLYHLVLPIKMADCHRHLGEFDKAQTEYRRAAGYRFINLNVEAPDLWRRIAENVQEWGDSLYRAGDSQAALPIYTLLMDENRAASDSFMYSTDSLSATGAEVQAWLTAASAEQPLPDLNPALSHVLHTVRLRWTYLEAGLDFFGNQASVVSPFTFRYLHEVARYFAQRAIQAEQRYIEFYTRFENGQMTRKELENAENLSAKEADAAKHREDAAEATVDLADASHELAGLRAQNAQAALDKFESVAGQLESLAGHIARGNAWTGSDLPNLDYGGPGYHFDDDKHKVLQQLTKLQTQISNDLQTQRLSATAAELQTAIGIADAQKDIADAKLKAAKIETDIAEERARHTGEMVEAFNNQFFDPEQWLAMASVMRSLANTALDRGIEVARLMQAVYNFENLDGRDAIRNSYKLAYTNDLLGGELLLNDIDSFTHYHVTRVTEKPIPVKWAVSLAEEYPGQFNDFARTGRIEFDIDIERLTLAHPGTYRHLLVGAELEIDGFLPPTGLHGRLSNSGLGRYRQADGSMVLRVQPAETLVLSRYDRRQDSIILAPPSEMRNLFEANSVASGWTLEVPRASNDVDLRVVFDIRLVLYFECLYDRRLFASDSQPAPGITFERSRVLHLRQHFPDAYFQLRETGRADLELIERDFPFNQNAPVLSSLSLAMVGQAGADLSGTALTVGHPGAGAAVDVVVDANQSVPAGDLPVAANSSTLGEYAISIQPDQIERKDQLDDLLLLIDYAYTPRS